MQINNLLLLSLVGIFVSADRKYDEIARRKLTSASSLLTQKLANEGGWSPLPPKASNSQCSLALDRIVKQPQNCGQKYMSAAARSVYDPIYNWFDFEAGVLADNVIEVAIQFAKNNGVGVAVYDAFDKLLANVDESGNIIIGMPAPNLTFNLARTWPLNYPTFVRNEIEGIASITQNIWSVQGQLLTVVISKSTGLLPVVC